MTISHVHWNKRCCLHKNVVQVCFDTPTKLCSKKNYKEPKCCKLHVHVQYMRSRAPNLKLIWKKVTTVHLVAQRQKLVAWGTRAPLRFLHMRGHDAGTCPSDMLQWQNGVLTHMWHVAGTCSWDIWSNNKVALPTHKHVPYVWTTHDLLPAACHCDMTPRVLESLEHGPDQYGRRYFFGVKLTKCGCFECGWLPYACLIVLET